MALVAYNLTGSAVALAAGKPAPPILPASNSPPSRGPGVNVTSELYPNLTVDPANGVVGGLDANDFKLIEAQIVARTIDLAWTDEPEYLTGGILPEGVDALKLEVDANEQAAQANVLDLSDEMTFQLGALKRRTEKSLDAAQQNTRQSLNASAEEQDDVLQSQIGLLQGSRNQIEKAASGDIQIVVLTGSAGLNIPAADLTNAADDSPESKRQYTLVLQSADGEVHRWANFDVVMTATKSNGASPYTVADIVWLPDPTKTPRFVNGYCELETQFDCGGKTYTAAETLTDTADIATAPTPPLYTSALCENVPDFDRVYTIT